MAYLPPTGFPITASPLLPSFQANRLRQFSPHTLLIGKAGHTGFGGLSTIEPLSASHY